MATPTRRPCNSAGYNRIRRGDHPLCGPNDIVFDRSGGFYFTDYGKHRERELKTAYITLSGTRQLVAMERPEPGLPLAYTL